MDELEFACYAALNKLVGLNDLVEDALSMDELTVQEMLEVTTAMSDRKVRLDKAVNNYYKALLNRLTTREP